MELMSLVAEAIWPGPQNSQCVVGGLVMKSPRCLVAIRLFQGEFSSEEQERKGISRILTFRKQCLGDMFTALGVTHEPEGNRNTLAGQKPIVILVRDGPNLS